MISYDLARQLKSAGWPQEKSRDVWGIGIGLGERGYAPRWSDDAKDLLHVVAAPSLEELIDASQPYFDSLVSIPQIVRGDEVMQIGGWEAHSRIDNQLEFALTPEEAVARLYLALHQQEV